MSTFIGFSEEDLKRIKSIEMDSKSVNQTPQISTLAVKQIDKIGAKPKKLGNQYKLPMLKKIDSDDSIDDLFEKCKLSLKSPTMPTDDILNNNDNIKENICVDNNLNAENNASDNGREQYTDTISDVEEQIVDETINSERKNSTETPPDIVRCVDNYTEDELGVHRAKLQELQLRQKIMEEQNKKRKEMLAKALADRTKQTEEEVLKLEKIKKELQVLDGQFSQDVAVLRKKIDQACLSFSDAEKHYLKVEKEFLQAKIQLQKEKEKKELLTEHLSALITHNETRKAHKLENLMLELANDKKNNFIDVNINMDKDLPAEYDEKPVIVDGVDERTGKMVELS